MELQFQKSQESCLQPFGWQVRQQEQTQELRLEDTLPDIGHVLGTWGQVLIRGKEWHNGSVTVSGGVMVWVLYASEEGDDRCVETWIPFQTKAQILPSDKDGNICVSPLLRNADARSISARKLMIRVNVSMLIQTTVPGKTEISRPDKLPPDVQLLDRTYTVLLPKEAGEKVFAMEEELLLPGSCPPVESLIRYQLQPELVDQKVMADKVVFRGIGILHLVYRGLDGQLHSWDFEVPFSQFAELDQIYDEQAQAKITPVLTSLEMEREADGQLRMKAGMLGQYTVFDRSALEVVEDVYGTQSQVLPHMELLQLPMVLDQTEEMVRAQLNVEANAAAIVDAVFYPAQPEMSEENGTMELTGRFCVLYYDPENRLCSQTGKWNGQWSWGADESCNIETEVFPSGMVQAAAGGSGIDLGADLRIRGMCIGQKGMPMVTGVTVQEKEETGKRPGLILRRLGDNTLWDVAKSTGSTVEDILEANGLTEAPAQDRILLIPIK